MTSHSLTVNLYHDGDWDDLTADSKVYTDIAANWSRWGANQLHAPTPGDAKLSLKNASGEFNPGNPTSIIYGSAGRNAPLQLGVDSATRWVGDAVEYRPKQATGGPRRCEVTGGGVLRRLGIGKSVATSALTLATLAANPVAYWPLTDGTNASIAGSPIPAGPIMAGSSQPDWAKVDGPPGAPEKLPECVGPAADGGDVVAFRAIIPAGAVGNSWTVDMILRAETAAADSGSWVVGTWQSGEVAWVLTLVRTGGGPILMLTADDYATTYISITGDDDVMDGSWHHLRVTASQSGATLTATVYVDGVSDGTDSATVTPGPIGSIRPFVGNVYDVTTCSIGHIAVYDGAAPADTSPAVDGYDGEYPGTRFVRVAGYKGITGTVVGTVADSQPMGPQPSAPIVDVLHECAVADGGIWYENTSGGLTLRLLSDMYNQTPALTLDATADLVPPLDPVIGDKLIRNDVTVQQSGGSLARATVDTGPLSVQAPPAGVGRYDTQLTVNTSDPTILGQYAGWLLSQTTVDGVQYEQIRIDMDASPTLDLSGVEIGSVVVLDGIPAVDDPDTPRLLVVGIAETVETHRRIVTLTVTSATPYQVGTLDTSGYLDCGGCTTNEALDTTETGVDVVITDECVWGHGSGDFDVLVGGERMTVTAVSAATGTYPTRYQTLTVTRSVNGVVKAHATGAEVHVADPIVLTL